MPTRKKRSEPIEPENLHRNPLPTWILATLVLPLVGTPASSSASEPTGDKAQRSRVATQIASLGSTDWCTRFMAAETLGKLRARAAAPHLINRLNDPDEHVRNVSAYALTRLGRSVVPAVNLATRNQAVNVRKEAVWVLGRLKDRRAVPALLAALRDAAAAVRSGAAAALGQIKDPRAATPLSNALKDPDPTVREQAARALGDLRTAQAIAPLAKALQDPAWKVRAAAAWALAALKTRKALAAVKRALRDTEHRVRRAAAHALAGFGTRAAGLLRKALRDRVSSVRAAAASSLGAIKDRRAIPLLIRALKDRASEVCSAAADALGKIGDRRAVKPLKRALSKADTFTRPAIKQALEKLEGGTVVGVNPKPFDILGGGQDDGTRSLTKTMTAINTGGDLPRNTAVAMTRREARLYECRRRFRKQREAARRAGRAPGPRPRRALRPSPYAE